MAALKDRIAEWHLNPPAWAKHFTARDWDHAELIAEELEAAQAPENISCDQAPPERYCVLEQGHAGACVTYEQP